MVTRHTDIHLRIIKDLIGKASGDFKTEFLSGKTRHLKFAGIRIEKLTISRHLLAGRLVLSHRRGQFRMFPHNDLHHVQRTNPVLQVRERIYHQLFQLAFGWINSGNHRFTHIALFNGMQLESNSIIGCGICRDVHPHLRGRKAAIQNSGSNTTKSYTYFIHTLPFLNYLLASLCLIFSTQYGVSLEMKFHARTNAFSGLRYGSGISTWWDSP